MKTTIKTSLTAALLCAGLTVQVSASPSPLDIWTWRNPLPTGNQSSSVTYGNGLFVAVGANSTILTSPDGVNWGQEI